MADTLEPTPDGQMSILFQNTTKYGRFECELWCKEARTVCEHIITHINSLCGATADSVISKHYVSFPFPPALSDADLFKKKTLNTLNISPRRGLLLFDTVNSRLLISLGPGIDMEQCLVFGRVIGNGLYQLHLFDDALTTKDTHKPIYDIVIDRCLVTECPFEVPMFTEPSSVQTSEKDSTSTVKVKQYKKNTKVLSFMSEDDDEDEGVRVKSCHDVIDDPRLSREPVPVPLSVPVSAESVESGTSEPEVSQEPVTEPSPSEPVNTVNPVNPTSNTDTQIQEQEQSSIIHEKIQSFLSTKPKTLLGKRRPSEHDTLSALNAFCAKLRQAPSADPPTAAPDEEAMVVCRLHGLVGCGSCTASFGKPTITDNDTDGGWMRHALRDQHHHHHY